MYPGTATEPALRTSAAPRCSIVIPVFNRVELTRQCLRELARAGSAVPYEVIVVDNGSSDGTAELLRTCGAALRTVANAENAGFARACNQGAALARAPYVVFLNNDTVPLPGWLDALVDEVERRPEVAVVGSKLLYEDGTLQHAGVIFSRTTFGPYHVYARLAGSFPAAARRRELRAVTGACMLVRRSAFAAAGGFDEAYRNGFEDIDLCLSIGRDGGRVVYQPASVLYHLESQTPGRKAHDLENLLRFRRRWELGLLEDEDSVYVADGFIIRASIDGSGIHHRLYALPDTPDRAAWERAAATQRSVAAGDLDRAAALLAAPDAWPAEASLLLWAQRLCSRLGVSPDGFCRRLVDGGPATLLLVMDVPTDDADAPFASAVLRRATGSSIADRLEGALAHVRLGAFDAARRECDAIRAIVPQTPALGTVEQLATRVRQGRGGDPGSRAPDVTFLLAPESRDDAGWAVAVGSYLRAFGPDDPCLLWLRADRARLTAAECLRMLRPVLAPFGAARFAPLSVSDDPQEPLPGARVVTVDRAGAWTPADFRRHLAAAS